MLPPLIICSQISSRVDGAELLQAAEEAGQGSEEDDYHLSERGSSDEDGSDDGELRGMREVADGNALCYMCFMEGAQQIM